MEAIKMEKDPKGGLRCTVAEDEVDSLTLRMLTDSGILGVIPVHQPFPKQKQKRELFYETEGLQPLFEYLAGGRRREEIFAVIESVYHSVVEIDRHYILRNQMLLKPEYLFWSYKTEQLFFMVLPIRKKYEEPDWNRWVKSLLMQIRYAEGENAQYIPALLNWMGKDSLKIEEIYAWIRNQKGSSYRHLPDPENQSSPFHGEAGTKQNMRSEPKSSAQDSVPPQKSVEITDAVPEKKPVRILKTRIESKMSEEKRMSLFYLLQHYSKENVQKYRHQQGAMQKKNASKQKTENQELFQASEIYGNSAESEKTGLLNLPRKPYRAAIIRVSTGQREPLSGEKIRLGKDPQLSDICITGNPAISRKHACIIGKGNQFYIQDCGSTNHTYLEGIRLDEGKEYLLQQHSHLRLADEEWIFEMERMI
ncbi:MAG: DUF6382 domain-containing protein [Peptoniphilaceae bacterium]|nr:DUF6382 domain-containing protein [Peptoniphilaceae bacterium]MDY5766709.1 DUF6382 domain-containing protein [Peptoniphilaceae bacterium]